MCMYVYVCVILIKYEYPRPLFSVLVLKKKNNWKYNDYQNWLIYLCNKIKAARTLLWSYKRDVCVLLLYQGSNATVNFNSNFVSKNWQKVTYCEKTSSFYIAFWIFIKKYYNSSWLIDVTWLPWIIQNHANKKKIPSSSFTLHIITTGPSESLTLTQYRYTSGLCKVYRYMVVNNLCGLWRDPGL
jgi:hypothetical protein